jgi:hypothetical protein
MRIANQQLLPAGTVVTTSLITKAIWLGHISDYAIQFVFSASNCNFKLQGSCDEGNQNAQAQTAEEAKVTNWSDIASSTVTVTGAGDVLYNIQNAGYNWVRVVITGTCTLTSARFNVKGV